MRGAPATPARAIDTQPRDVEVLPRVGQLVVVVPVDEVEPLRRTLNDIDHSIRTDDDPPPTEGPTSGKENDASGAVVRGPGRKRRTPLDGVESLHMARWVILPARVRDRGIDVGASLMLWTIFDGEQGPHLDALLSEARALFDAVYAHCKEYPLGGDNDAVRAYLLRHEAPGPVASYDGTPGRSKLLIDRQAALARELACFVRKRKAENLPNHHIFVEAQNFVDGELRERDPGLAEFARRRFDVRARPWAVDVVRTFVLMLSGAGRLATWLAAILLVALCAGGAVFGLALADTFSLEGVWRILLTLLFVVLNPLAALPVAVLLWSLKLQDIEGREALRWIPLPSRDFEERDHCLRELENEGPGRINRMTIVTDVKPGFVRKVVMSVVLGIVSFRAARNVVGVLNGLETIHFAEWRLVDGGRRLLFMSNYDGEALGYFRDFSVQAAPGINAIWGNTEGFPPTRNLIGEGSRNLEAFQNAARMHQVPTDVWYCGYPTRRFDTGTINDNFRIHWLLNSFPPPGVVDQWVEALAPRGG